MGMALAAIPLLSRSLIPHFSVSHGCRSVNLLSILRTSANGLHFFTKTCKRKHGSPYYPSAFQHDSTTEDDYSVLCAITSQYNHIVILENPNSRILLLDSTHNIHSIYNKGHKWTGSYWDEFATLPAIVPQGPIAILGLGGGTAAHLMLELCPSLKLEGWEIDEILIDQAREYLGLSHLEKCNQAGGILFVHVGDALSHSAVIPGGFAGIVVDLFSDGKVLPQLQEAATWLELNKRLMPHGRIMVNCAGADVVASNNGYGTFYANDGAWNDEGLFINLQGELSLSHSAPTIS
ncbi:uncharacterized protein LOC143857277 isoform X2 [Tasmannia lanceolata]|uniref:uncharacterized protein LOC143857277 isoform X2 n=1 Tax=Tasmannia lanceolata TaxID=3420 RepID=UPI00406496DC